jgi:tetratricopeptide (TPR) repeat protein
MVTAFQRFAAGFLMFLCLQGAAAQSGSSIFAPFVTRLNAEVSGKAVRLKWQDSTSVKGPVYVYRARVPFSGAGAQYQARALEVPYGQQIFIEEVEALGMWYYFVVASDETHMKYEIVVPYSNIVDVQLDGTSKNVSASPGIAGTATPYADTPIISQPAQPAAEDPTWDSAYGSYGVARQSGYARYSSDIVEIMAQPLPNGIYISYRSSERGKNALLYRSNKPFTQYSDILTASLIKEHLTSPYVDYPPPGVPSYYAVLYDEDIRSGQAAIYPGNNATVNPVQLGSAGQGASGIAGAPAYSPIPASPQQQTYLDPGSGYFSTVRSPSPLSAESAQVAESLRNRTETAPVVPKSSFGINMEPRVFNQDVQNNAASGEDYDLAVIVRGSFFRKDWGIARIELQRYLSVSHSQNAAARAHFYLGQCYYFLGDARSALNEFMSVHSLFPDEAASWVQAALAKTGERRY